MASVAEIASDDDELLWDNADITFETSDCPLEDTKKVVAKYKELQKMPLED